MCVDIRRIGSQTQIISASGPVLEYTSSLKTHVLIHAYKPLCTTISLIEELTNRWTTNSCAGGMQIFNHRKGVHSEGFLHSFQCAASEAVKKEGRRARNVAEGRAHEVHCGSARGASF